MSIFTKIEFFFRKPKAVIILGANAKEYKEIISRVLSKDFKIEKDIFIFSEILEKDIQEQNLRFLIQKSSLPILLLNNISQGKITLIKSLLKDFPYKGFLILNADQEEARLLKDEFDLPVGKEITFGQRAESDFQASDVNVEDGLNFKINHKGSSVPVWLKEKSEDQIPLVLAAASVAVVLGLNLVEVSQALKP